jgi:Alternative complex III, ActD subunit
VTKPGLYGLMAEFSAPADVVAAARRIHEAGYRRVDAFSPYPMEALSEALGLHHSRLPLLVLLGGLAGLLAGYGLEYWASVIEYPMNVGGRPYHSWVSFIPPAFETTILFAALTAVLGMLALNGLPEPYHPVFNVPTFALATRDRFFICIEATDPRFDLDQTWRFLLSLGPMVVSEVEQ